MTFDNPAKVTIYALRHTSIVRQLLAGVPTRLRAHVNRDRYSREIESIHGAEGPGRLGLSLERLFAGLAAISLSSGVALRIVEDIALGSTPRSAPMRKKQQSRRQYRRHRDRPTRMAAAPARQIPRAGAPALHGK